MVLFNGQLKRKRLVVNEASKVSRGSPQPVSAWAEAMDDDYRASQVGPGQAVVAKTFPLETAAE